MEQKECMDVSKWFEKIDGRLSAIEEYEKIIMVTNVMQDLDKVCDEAVRQKCELWLNERAADVIMTEIYEKKILVYIMFRQKAGMKEIRCLRYDFVSEFDYIPVFEIPQIKGVQRKKMLEEKISYHIPEKEKYIFLD